MVKLVLLAGLLLLIVIVAAVTRLMPRSGAETATPQQVYFQLHSDDELIAKP